jgi:hypothetical protein
MKDELTDQQINALIAERVVFKTQNVPFELGLFHHREECPYGAYQAKNGSYFCNKCGWLYDPRNNVEQSVQALEAWCKAEIYRHYMIHSWPSKIVKLHQGGVRVGRGYFNNQSLSKAITDALVQALEVV